MIEGIDDDLYCFANAFIKENCEGEDCIHKHHKYPTLDQYKEEYGEGWKGAVYCHCTCSECTTECDAKGWTTNEYGCLHNPIIVCACTPFGKPPSGWRPK